MWNLALDVADRGQRVLFVPLEQRDEELAIQATAKYSRVPTWRIERAHGEEQLALPDSETDAIERAERHLAALDMRMRLHSAEQHGRTLRDVLASATRSRFDAVFVDHVGMIGRGSGKREVDLVQEAIEGLRGLARGEVVPGYTPFVCVTSPLNRDSEREGEEKRKPVLADFRGSGNIESDADFAMILRKRKRNDDDESSEPDVVDGFVLKNRQGRSPLFLTFDCQGAICFVREREPEPKEPPAQHWQDHETDA